MLEFKVHLSIQDTDDFVQRDLIVSGVRRPEEEHRDGCDVAAAARRLEVAHLAEGVAVARLRRLAGLVVQHAEAHPVGPWNQINNASLRESIP